MRGPVNPVDVLAGQLLPGESIRWCGQPRGGLILRWTDIVFIPFSLLWGGFAIFWESLVLGEARSMGWFAVFFLLFGLPFVMLGLYMICGRFIVDAWRRARTVYVLTERRALIVQRPPWEGVRAVAIDRLLDVSVSHGIGGRGTIRFRTRALSEGEVRNLRHMSRRRLPLDWTLEFFAIDNVDSVFSAIQRRRPAPTG